MRIQIGVGGATLKLMTSDGCSCNFPEHRLAELSVPYAFAEVSWCHFKIKVLEVGAYI